MKVSKHVEQLLRQGKKPKELVELGFPKSVVTRVHRQLREEKAALQPKTPKGRAEAKSRFQPSLTVPVEMAPIQQKLASLESAVQKVDNLAKALPEVAALAAAAQELGSHRRENCPYEEDGLCVAQTWTDRSEIPRGIGEPVLIEEEKPRWYIRPSDFYCAVCTAPLEDRMNDVESEVSGDPLSGAKEQITCQSCGSKGFIAAAVKCTKCGHETYWGWCPKR